MIGNILRKEREKKKLSIRDIENETSIRTVYIEAIEKGEYDKLPGEVYAKGFIKNYANFLNLNGEEFVRQFVMEISTVAATDENSADATPKTSIKATNLGEKYNNNQQENSGEISNFEGDSKKYFVAAAALIMILIGSLIYGFGGSDEKVARVETKPATVEVKPVPVEVKPVPVTVEEKIQPVPEPVQVAVTPAGVNLQATFSGDCWTRVIVDGGVAYEGMIVAGQSFDWNGKESVNVLLGNAGAAQFVMNGQTVGTIGAYGDVVEKNFTR